MTFEGKRYTGHKWNTAIDMIMARGKKYGLLALRVNP